MIETNADSTAPRRVDDRVAEKLAGITGAVADVSAATPSEIDAVLAQTYALTGAYESYRDSAVDSVHRALGERGRQYGGWTSWPTTTTEALAAARARAADPAYREIPASRRDVVKPLEAVDQYDAILAAITAAEAPFQRRYEAERWNRYFWARSSGGHGHRTMRCTTCNKGRQRTRFDWHPELSGLTDDDAIKAFNAQMCTVCFPDAPVVAKDTNHCKGSRVAPVKNTDYRVGMRWYGTCTGCGDNQLLAGSNVRAHKAKPSTRT